VTVADTAVTCPLCGAGASLRYSRCQDLEYFLPHLPSRALRQVLTPRDDLNRYTRSRWRVLRTVYAGLPPR
jgi:hypothetical protein